MVAEFANKDFSIAGLAPGQAEDWTISAFLQLPGWAKFRTYGGFVLSERFDWFDSYAKQWSGVEPFALDESLTLTIANVGVDPLNYFEISGDVRRLLPVTSCFKIVGTTPGQTNLDAYWTVLSIEFDGTDTRIYVTEDVLASVPANIIIPPIVYANIDNYGWGGRVDSLATYPIGPFVGGETLDVALGRETPIVITFAGGETTAQDIVDLLNTEFVSLSVDGELIGVVENSVPVIKTLIQGTGQYLEVTGGTADATLLFANFEQYGFGQFAQLFDIYFSDPANATAEEIDDIFKQYIQHGYFRSRESEDGGNVLVRSEKAGDLATCQVWGYNGDVMSGATWPISARTALDNELDIVIDGGTPFTATLTVGATTAEEVADDILTAMQSNGVVGFVEVAGNGQVVVGGFLSAQITGGSANTDLIFPTHVVYGNNRVHSLLGFSADVSTGVYDVGFFDELDDATVVAANFAGGTTVESQYETFEWTNVIGDLDEATIIEAQFKSWAEWANKGEITAVVTGVGGSFTVSGDKTDFFFSGVGAMVQDSTGNDKLYTVASSSYALGFTVIVVIDDVVDPTVDGDIFPMVFANEAEDFDQAWQTSFLSNPNDAPHRFDDGVLVGDDVTFPIDIAANRNEMWIYVGSEENLVHISVDPGGYDTAAELAANMNTKFSSASASDLEFSVHEENSSGTIAKIGFGWNGSGSTTEEFYFANQNGLYEGLDIRATIGMINFVGGVTTRIAVPSRYFANIEGVAHGKVPDTWQDDPQRFDVDPDSRFSYTIQTTPAAETVVVPEGQAFALFNQVATPDNAANEAFVPEGWGGAILDEPAFAATLTVAWFDQDLTPQDVEDFEEGW